MSRTGTRWHPGAALHVTYRKMSSIAICSGCGWYETAGTEPADLVRVRLLARDHAALERHKVTVFLAQRVTYEPTPPGETDGR
jgi:hypothetical protein